MSAGRQSAEVVVVEGVAKLKAFETWLYFAY